MIAFAALVAVSLQLAPYLSGADIFFGITVAPAFRQTAIARAISRRYAIEIWGFAAVVALLAGRGGIAALDGPMLLAQAIGGSVAFVNARRAVLPHAVAPATRREADLGPRERLPGGPIAQVGPFLILAAAAVYVALHWDAVPARFPTHWNLAGRPDGWSAKSLADAYRGLVFGAFACAMTAGASYGVLHFARLPRVDGPAGIEARRVRRINLIAMLASQYLIALLLAWTTMIAMTATPNEPLPIAFRLAPFVFALAAGTAIRVARRAAPHGGTAIGDTTPDACWWFGQIYVNRTDPTLLVAKRAGIGYTLNLGNPLAWLVVVAGAAMILVLLLL